MTDRWEKVYVGRLFTGQPGQRLTGPHGAARSYRLLAGHLVVILGLMLLVPTTADSADRTEQNSIPEPYITSFEGLDWGASSSLVEETHGDPEHVFELHRDHPDGPSKLLTSYPLELHDEQAWASFVFRENEGFIRGSYWVPFGITEKCEVVYDRFEQEINHQFPDIEPETSRENFTDEDRFCEASGVGYAYRGTTWSEPVTNARVSMNLVAGSILRISYEAPDSYRIEAEVEQAE